MTYNRQREWSRWALQTFIGVNISKMAKYWRSLNRELPMPLGSPKLIVDSPIQTEDDPGFETNEGSGTDMLQDGASCSRWALSLFSVPQWCLYTSSSAQPRRWWAFWSRLPFSTGTGLRSSCCAEPTGARTRLWMVRSPDTLYSDLVSRQDTCYFPPTGFLSLVLSLVWFQPPADPSSLLERKSKGANA